MTHKVSAADVRYPNHGLYVAADSMGVSVTLNGETVIADMSHDAARELIDRLQDVLPERETAWPDPLANFPTIRPEA